MLHFEGDTDFSQPPTFVRAKLSDVSFLASCIPDLQSATPREDGTVVCVVRPGFSFIRGTLEVTIQVAEAVEGQPLRIQAHGKGIGSSNDVELALQFAERDGGTQIHWTADVTKLGGLLKAMPTGLLKGAAQKVIADVWQQAKQKVAEAQRR
jgi:carbon monoxide dehydrogenase subunit G